MKRRNKLLLFLFLNLFLVCTVYAKDECASVDFTKKQCEISIGGFIGIGAKKCNSGYPVKVYSDSISAKKVVLTNKEEVVTHGLCYYDGNRNAYFYAVYRSNTKKCILSSALYVPVHSKASSLVQKTNDQIGLFTPTSGTLNKSDGCARYFYVDTSNSTKPVAIFSYTNTGTYNWIDESNLGATESDSQTKEQKKSCIFNKIITNDSYCNAKDETSRKKILEQVISSCYGNLSSGRNDSLYESEKNELMNYAKSIIGKTVGLYCHLKEKCGDIDKTAFAGFVSDNSSTISDSTRINKYFSGDKAACILSNFNTQEAKDKQNQAGEEIAEVVGAAEDKEQQDFKDTKGSTNTVHDVKSPTVDFDNSIKTCSQLLGPSLSAVVKAGVRAIQIAGAIIAIVKGMMILIPAVVAKDADGLKKASKTLTMMAIILVIIFMFPGLLRFIGKIAGFDISCLV